MFSYVPLHQRHRILKNEEGVRSLPMGRDSQDSLRACWWVTEHSDTYHIREWNVLVDDDTRFFEFLSLEILQAGLSWRLIMQRRSALRRALEGFIPARIATWKEEDLAGILQREGMIRHEGKLRALWRNAQVFLRLTSTQSFLAHILNEAGLDKPYSAYERIFRHFSFFGSTMQREFLESSGIIGKEHDPACFFNTLSRRKAEEIIRQREAYYAKRLIRHDATLRRRFPELTERIGSIE